MKSVAEQKRRVALLSVASNTMLVVLKLVVGLAIGSISVISEAIHSGVDLLAALIALMAVRIAARAPTKKYPFGHGKVENISGTIEALLIFLAAGWIILEAVEKLIHPRSVETPGWGVAVMLVSALANLGISTLLFRVAKQTDSVALAADAWHLRTDVYTSAGVMAGLAVISLGAVVAPGLDLDWVDPVVAIGVALLIVHAAYELTSASARDLLDVSLPDHEIATIHARIVAFGPRILGFHDLKTRKSGSDRFVEFHVVVDASLPAAEAHAVTEQITSRIRADYPGTTVTIQVEPCEGECSPRCVSGCLVGAPRPADGSAAESPASGSSSQPDETAKAAGPAGGAQADEGFSIRASTELLFRGVFFYAGKVMESLVTIYRAALAPDAQVVADFDKTMALRLVRTGQAAGAIPILERLLAQNPADLATRRLLARAHRDCDQIDRAARHLEAILEKAPDSARTLRALGFIRFHQKEYDGAIDCLRRASEVDPNDAVTFYRLGLACEGMGRHQDALASFRRTVELMPTFAKAHQAMGLTYATLGDRESAVASMKRATELRATQSEPDPEPEHDLRTEALG